MLAAPKPIFIAINGPLPASGCAFCRIRRFSLHGGRRKAHDSLHKRGLIAEHGISWMLPRLIGTMNALDLLCSARTIEAREADDLGLVRTLPAEGFLAAVQAKAREMATTASPRSIGVIKRQVYNSHFQSLAEAWAVADKEMIASFASEDFKEASRISSKRAPAFTWTVADGGSCRSIRSFASIRGEKSLDCR